MVDQLFQKYQGNDVPGAAVMVVRDGLPVLTKTYGMANLEEKTQVTSRTNFRLASATKQFTAMCIMLLVDRGKLQYSTTLTDIWPEFPEYGSDVAVRHLLQHTSGLIAYEALMPDTATVQVSDDDVLNMMMHVDSTYFEPGTEYRYSNSGYALLARIIEEVSGMTFASFLHENIFAPLRMENTLAYQKGISEVPHRAYGYSVKDDTITLSDQSPTSAVLGDGGIYTSVDDLQKWYQALRSGKLLGHEKLAQAFIPNKENYGFGWRIGEYKGLRLAHHTGSTRGFRNVVFHFLDEELTIIVLTNRDGPGIAPLAEALADLYLTTGSE